MEMLQLRYFYESAQAENFSKTAKKYMVPVSSVSASVKRLEKELGVALFDRTGNRILLTEKGKQFLSVVENTLSQLDAGVSAVASEPAKGGTLRVLVRCTRQTVTRRILKFHRLYPAVSFKLAFEDEPENFDRYDVVISSFNEALSGYLSFEMYRSAIHVVALETDPLCKRNVTLNQLKDRLFVTTNAQRGSFDIFVQACKHLGFTPKVFLECDDYACWDLAILSGECLGLTLGNTAHTNLPNVQYLNVSDFNECLVGCVYYKQEKYNGNVKLFVDFLKNNTLL